MPGGLAIPPAFSGFITANSAAARRGVSISGNASANVVGAYTAIYSSTPADADGFFVFISGFSVGGPSAAIDVAVGAGGSEINIANQLMLWSTAGDANSCTGYHIPVAIPAGTKVSARMQSDRASEGCNVNIVTYQGDFVCPSGFAGVESLGFQSSVTGGTTVDCGGVVNTWGAYTQIISSTVRDYAGLLVNIDGNNTTAASISSMSFAIVVAIGSAGNEVDIIPGIVGLKNIDTTGANKNIWVAPSVTGPYWVPVPAGSRLSARAVSADTTANERLIGVTLYGIYA